jgi:hypothetical protein
MEHCFQVFHQHSSTDFENSTADRWNSCDKSEAKTNLNAKRLVIYRTSVVSVVSTFQWPDTADIFEREPYIVRFRASNYG